MTSREEFERTNGRDHRRQPPKGNNYTDPMAQADWESFQKGWYQSRAALVIEAPYVSDAFNKDHPYVSAYMEGLKDFREAIESAGLKVKS